MRKLIVGAALSAAVIVNLASAQTFDPQDVYSAPDGFFTGSHYEALPRNERLRYLAGLMDGFLYADMLSANGYKDHKRTDQLSRCDAAVGMTDVQFMKIVDDFMDKHPDYWGAQMNGSALSALALFCKKVGDPINLTERYRFDEQFAVVNGHSRTECKGPFLAAGLSPMKTGSGRH